MKLNKKSKSAEVVKDKILKLLDTMEKHKQGEKFMEDYLSMKDGMIDPNPDIFLNAKQFSILDKYDENKYFTDNEKNFIINYLIECLVDNQPFDCSSLGPNKYLNE